MTAIVNRAKMYTTTAGTGPIVLTTPVSGFQSFQAAGVANRDVIGFAIEDQITGAWGIYTGTYTTASMTLTRTLIESSNSGAEISLSGNAEVYVTVSAQDMMAIKAAATAAMPSTLAALTALLKTAPTTLPGTSGVLWWNAGVLNKTP